jgi:hypothetical protein
MGMPLTTCRTCHKPVAVEAPTCPQCGVLDPGEGHEQRAEAAKRDSAQQNRWLALGCGGPTLLVLLLLGGGAVWTELTRVELDGPARDACYAVSLFDLDASPVEQGASRVQAVGSAVQSDVEGLREVLGSSSLDPGTVNDDYRAVAEWCGENYE